MLHVAHAASAIASGRAEVVLITHGQGHPTGYRTRPASGDTSELDAQYEIPYGIQGAPARYALAAMRHMAQYGTTKEQLAEIAVQTRQWASLNPKALKRDPITVDDVSAPRWSPIRSTSWTAVWSLTLAVLAWSSAPNVLATCPRSQCQVSESAKPTITR